MQTKVYDIKGVEKGFIELDDSVFNVEVSDGAIYCVIFSSITGMQTYNTIMSGACIGDTMYCNGEQI